MSDTEHETQQIFSSTLLWVDNWRERLRKAKDVIHSSVQTVKTQVWAKKLMQKVQV